MQRRKQELKEFDRLITDINNDTANIKERITAEI